jgi:hypothetical protein
MCRRGPFGRSCDVPATGLGLKSRSPQGPAHLSPASAVVIDKRNKRISSVGRETGQECKQDKISQNPQRFDGCDRGTKHRSPAPGAQAGTPMTSTPRRLWRCDHMTAGAGSSYREMSSHWPVLAKPMILAGQLWLGAHVPRELVSYVVLAPAGDSRHSRLAAGTELELHRLSKRTICCPSMLSRC